MKRFKNILCYHTKNDGSAALDRAVRLAKENQAKLTVVDVIEAFPKKYITKKVTAIKKFHTATLRESKIHLDKIITLLQKKGLRIQAKVLQGIPFLEIIRKVLHNKHDLVITAVQPRKNLKDKMFGSTAVRLMRKCPCPVWAIKTSQVHAFNRIMAAVDPDPMNEKKTALNHKIIELSTSLAEMEKSDLYVVHCWAKYPELLMGFGYTDLPPIMVDNILYDTKNIHKKWLNEFMQKISIKRGLCCAKLVPGDPGEQIPKLAKKEKVDLIVMGTVCRVGIPGLLIGNTAEKVLNQVDCSLLTIKPDGFNTPIKVSK